MLMTGSRGGWEVLIREGKCLFLILALSFNDLGWLRALGCAPIEPLVRSVGLDKLIEGGNSRIAPREAAPAQTSRESLAELGVASRAAKSARADGSWQRYR